MSTAAYNATNAAAADWHPEDRTYVIWITAIVTAATIAVVILVDWYKKRREMASVAEEVCVKHHAVLTQQQRRDMFQHVLNTSQVTMTIGKDNLKAVDDLDVENGQCEVDIGADAGEQQLDREHSNVLVFHKIIKTNSYGASKTSKKESITSALCAICLEPYQEGEAIVWSSNKECPHVYHQECFLDYLANKKDSELHDNPCPTCRRNFCKALLV
ncbi:MAG: hypothetical protein SGILL_004678 [Bacillariaceae sp.]